MADIFISYKRQDTARIQPLVRFLECAGYSIWWDQGIEPGDEWFNRILDELEHSALTIGVWTQASVDGRGAFTPNQDGKYYVRIEHNKTKAGRLLPVVLDEGRIAVEFEHVQAVSLIGWNGEASAEGCARLLARVQALLGSRTSVASALAEAEAERARAQAEREKADAEKRATEAARLKSAADAERKWQVDDIIRAAQRKIEERARQKADEERRLERAARAAALFGADTERAELIKAARAVVAANPAATRAAKLDERQQLARMRELTRGGTPLPGTLAKLTSVEPGEIEKITGSNEIGPWEVFAFDGCVAALWMARVDLDGHITIEGDVARALAGGKALCVYFIGDQQAGSASQRFVLVDGEPASDSAKRVYRDPVRGLWVFREHALYFGHGYDVAWEVV
ncbi:toll/interleukin-1 receptor domain-containing protein [Terricaulis sp.]|uniref:toll/interleukin-1 receptor domain-containing protein n=1 Tax=Terricaulis sp. TaxID=2768686 RepID=UPI00378420B0